MARSVRLNIAANYLGGGWSALMGFIFVPLYVSFLGIEAYGLIGLFATLQAWISLLDLGLSPTLNREMARLQGGAHTSESIRDLLRSIEVVYGTTALAIAAAVYFGAGWLAINWLRAETLSLHSITSALSITGIVIAFRWIGGLYRNALGGLQEQVWLNVSNVVFSTLRGAGVIAVLAFVSNSIEAFFIFQGIVALLEAATLAILVHRALPSSTRRATFSPAALQSIWRFAAGVTTISVLSLLLTQIDKVILPTILPLSEFGYYVLAGAVAGGLSAVVGPIASAVGPRFSELATGGSGVTAEAAYHRYSQLLAVILVPACSVVALFSDRLILLWTHSLTTTAAVSPIVSILVIGTALNGLTVVPFLLQLAYGRTRLLAIANAVAGVILIPTIYILSRLLGPIGAALTSLALNLGYMFVIAPTVQSMLPVPMGKLRTWYLNDLLPPVVTVLLVLVPYRLLVGGLQSERPSLGDAAVVVVATLLAGTASVAGTPIGREIAVRLGRRTRSHFGR